MKTKILILCAIFGFTVSSSFAKNKTPPTITEPNQVKIGCLEQSVAFAEQLVANYQHTSDDKVVKAAKNAKKKCNNALQKMQNGKSADESKVTDCNDALEKTCNEYGIAKDSAKSCLYYRAAACTADSSILTGTTDKKCTATRLTGYPCGSY